MKKLARILTGDHSEVGVEIEYTHHAPEIIQVEGLEARIPGDVTIHNITVMGAGDPTGEYSAADALNDHEVAQAKKAVEDYLAEKDSRIFEALGLV